MATYNVTTNFGAKDDLASGNVAKKIKGSEFTTEFTNISTAVNSKADTTTVNAVTTTANAALPKAGGAMTGAITTNSTFDGVDIATRDGVLTSTTTTANAALPKSGGAMTGAITTNSTFDGVDIATRDGVLTTTTNTANAALPKAGGTMTGDITLPNGGQLKLSNTASLYSSSGGTYLSEFGAGDLSLMAKDIYFRSDSGGSDTDYFAKFIYDGGVELYYNGTKTTETTSTGLLVATVANPIITLKNTDTTIVADQVIGTVEFRGADDSGNILAGHIQQVSSLGWGSGSYNSDMVFSTKTGGSGGPFTEKLRLEYGGVKITGAATVTTAAAANATASTFKNGTLTAGKINTHQTNGDGYLSIGNKAAGLRFVDYQASRFIVPFNVDTNANSDNLIDLGNASARFDDIYATNATIQTSDRNEKQDIEELTDAETRVAVACKGLLRKFRWKSSVEENGAAARTHFGIIAQDLQAAFEAEGLDAGEYAMFISTTWTNEDGEEQTRLGVRYSELLAFIIGGI